MNNTMTKPEIKLEQIVRTYNGRPGCACGCRGSYMETKRAFTAALAKYAQAPAESVEMGSDLEGNAFVGWDNEDRSRTYTIYFKEAA